MVVRAHLDLNRVMSSYHLSVCCIVAASMIIPTPVLTRQTSRQYQAGYTKEGRSQV